MTDWELISLIRSGHEKHWDELINRYTPYIECLIKMFSLYQITNDLDDIRQLCKYELTRCVHCYDIERKAQFKTYVNHCVKNTILSYIRRERCHIKRVSYSLDNQTLYNENTTHLELVENNVKEYDHTYIHTQLDIEEVLKKIHLKFGSIAKKIILLKVKGYSYQEIAEKLNINRKKVDNIIQSIRRSVK